MQQTKLNIPALLGARICHDLISPVGAIGNGLELLSLTGNVSGPEANLISDSVTNANARLKYFRLAFGGNNDDQIISCNEIREILSGYYSDDRLSVTFEGSGDIPKSIAKLLLLLTLCCDSGMGSRGKVTLYQDGSLQCVGDKLPNKHPLFTNLRNGDDWPEGLGASNVHFPLAESALLAAGLQLQCSVRDQTFSIWTKAALPDLLINREPSRPQRQGT